MERSLRRTAVLALLLFGCGDCDDDPTASARMDASDRDAMIAADAAVPVFDAGLPPPPFMPSEPPEPIPAHNEFPLLDGATPSEAAVDSGTPVTPPPEPDCLTLEPGDDAMFMADLSADKRWFRIDPENGCPAAVVTADDVAYASYVLCPFERDRTLEIIMRGADMLSMPPPDAVADPMLAVYPDEEQAHDDPFACLAANDDGVFDGLLSNSARIEGLIVPAGERVVVLATSFEPPEQHGVGPYSIELRAE